jgi:hypothetical protein
MKLIDNKDQFDEGVPSSGHELRFERRLRDSFGERKTHFYWIKIAVSLFFVLAATSIWFYTENKDTGVIEIADKVRNEIPVEEAEQYYKQSFKSQFDIIAANYTSLEGKNMIEESNILIQKLDLQYQTLEKELEETGDQRVAAAMINNYKSRIQILETLVRKLKFVTQLKKEKNENFAS